MKNAELAGHLQKYKGRVVHLGGGGREEGREDNVKDECG